MLEALLGLTHAINRQCVMLGALIEQNDDLVQALADRREDEEPTHDLSGRPLL